jgi:hypothetical protein
VTRLSLPQIKRRTGRNVEQFRVFLFAFHPRMTPGQRRFEVVGNVLVKLLILFFRDFVLGACPQRIGLIEGFFLRLVDDLFFPFLSRNGAFFMRIGNWI